MLFEAKGKTDLSYKAESGLKAISAHSLSATKNVPQPSSPVGALLEIVFLCCSMSTSTPLERYIEKAKDEILVELKKEVMKINRRLDHLEPSSCLPPIPSPTRGASYTRNSNVAFTLREEIDARNAKIVDGHEKYIQFLEGDSDKKLNTDAKDALDLILLHKMVKIMEASPGPLQLERLIGCNVKLLSRQQLCCQTS